MSVIIGVFEFVRARVLERIALSRIKIYKKIEYIENKI